MKILITKLFFILSYGLFATTFTTVSNGDWNDNSTWDANGKPGTYWGTSDQVVINHTINLDQNVGYAGSLTINSSGSLSSTNRNVALYNGASIIANGNLTVNNLTLNATSNGSITAPLEVDNNLVVGTNSTLICTNTVDVNNKFTNNGGVVTFNNATYIDGNLENNDGTITFNGPTIVNGNVDNNNSNAVLNVNNDIDISGNVKLNSSSELNIVDGAEMNVDGNFTANSGTSANIDGRLNVDGNFTNNGGEIENNGVVDISGNFTQNGGTFTNNGVMLVNGNFRVNGGGTVNGTGILRTDNITNYGTISGSNDICGLDDATATSTAGGGAYSGGTTYCTESAAAALPIELAYFKASFKDHVVYFEWKTLSETNNNFFTIEFSADGENFKPIAKELGAGNSTKEILYSKSLIDASIKKGYFRLKQTDFDGKFTYSKEVFIEHRKSNLNDKISVYPNPNPGQQLFVELEDVSSGSYRIDLLNSSGVRINSKDIAIEEFTTYTEINLLDRETLPKGVYFVRISSFEEVTIKKVIVK